MIERSTKEGGETDSEIQIGTSTLGIIALIFIPFCATIQYMNISDLQHNAKNLITLNVTSSDSPVYMSDSGETGITNERCILKAQEFNCHFRIVGDAMQIVTGNRETKELLQSIKRHDKLTLIISKDEKKELASLYFDVRLFGLSKNDDILFSPERLAILREDDTSSFLIKAAILEFVIALGLIWKAIRAKKLHKTVTQDVS